MFADLLRTARDLQVPYVVGWVSADKEDTTRANIDRLLPLAEELGVGLLIKTSGIYADTGRLRRLLDRFASDYLAALWDVHHPYRDFGESSDATIKNLGATIPKEELPLLFDRFHKADSSRSMDREGVGLGLYIVKTIVCSHGEDISVSSGSGVTEFTFTLPLMN